MAGQAFRWRVSISRHRKSLFRARLRAIARSLLYRSKKSLANSSVSKSDRIRCATTSSRRWKPQFCRSLSKIQSVSGRRLSHCKLRRCPLCGLNRPPLKRLRRRNPRRLQARRSSQRSFDLPSPFSIQLPRKKSRRRQMFRWCRRHAPKFQSIFHRTGRVRPPLR